MALQKVQVFCAGMVLNTLSCIFDTMGLAFSSSMLFKSGDCKSCVGSALELLINFMVCNENPIDLIESKPSSTTEIFKSFS